MVAFGAISHRLRWLSSSGSIAASVFGFCLLYWGDLSWLLPVLVFFATSSILSKIKKRSLAFDHDALSEEKEDVRDAKQVLANGGVAWLLFMVYQIEPNQMLFAGFVGAFAAATADTWGTEIGRLAKGSTRSVITGKSVPRGESGGISWQGTLGGFVGAAIVAFVAVGDDILLGLAIAVAGVWGSLVDSFLGAALQVRYRDIKTGEITEKKMKDEPAYEHLKGIKWLDNNMVNFCCTVSGAAIASLIGRML